MKINGQVIDQPNVEVIVIPRGQKSIVFKAQAVLNYDIFFALCPKPTPPMVMKKGELVGKLDETNTSYIEALNTWAEKKYDWMIIQSLAATENLVWDTVKLEDPLTWGNIQADLDAAKFTQPEQFMIIEGVMAANSLSSKRIQEARDAFFAQEAAKETVQG